MQARFAGWALVVVAAASLGTLGCAGEVQVEAKTSVEKTPEKPKAPPDADGDGFPDDGTDECITEKEDGLPPSPKDGCKTNDADNDGVAGVNDKCPNEPETKNSHQDEDGCPDEVPRVVVTKTEVKITEKILFAFGKATIDAKSEGLLKDIAKVVNEHPEIGFLEVAGHADKVGDDAVNVRLTKKRAQAVVDALVKLGVDKTRMRAEGYGRYCPLDPGDSEEARERNRRVEFKIMRLEGKDTGIELGCADALAKGIKPAGVPATAPKGPAPTGDAKPAAPTPAGAKPADAKPADAKPAAGAPKSP
jgi:outer membrane protein OmpA-like peptidoglycan-associated protein